jgi:hypothetical protein
MSFHHRFEMESRVGVDERGMKAPSGEAKADDGRLDLSVHHSLLKSE